MVEVLGGSLTRMDFIFNTIQAGHHQRRKAQIGVGRWVRETRLDAAALGVGHKRDADRGRAVARAVGQFDRCLKTGHQTFVAIGSGVGDGIQGTRMLDDAADVVQGKVAQPSVAVTSKQVFTVFPDRLVHMHARAVVARIGLGHEGGCFAVGIRHVPDHVLEHLSPVGALHQGAKAGANLVLASACHLMVEHLNRDAQRLKNERHFSAHVLGAVDRGHWKVAAFDRGTMAPVTAFELGTRAPGSFVFVDFKEYLAWLIAPAHAVKNEEFRLGAEEGRVANAGSLEVGLGPLGN